jgi:electron transfer flavoprotein-quinone oxidoreductase
MLESSFVMREMKFYAKAPHFLESAPGMFRGYPEMIRDIMNPLFIVDGKPRKHVMDIAMPPVKKTGLFSLAKVAMKGVKAL